MADTVACPGEIEFLRRLLWSAVQDLQHGSAYNRAVAFQWLHSQDCAECCEFLDLSHDAVLEQIEALVEEP